MKQSIVRIDLGGVNSYLLKEGDNFLLIDTGGHILREKDHSIKRNKLKDQLDKAGVGPENLRLLIITHGDIDHTANASYIREKYNTKIAMHKNDLALVKTAELDNILSNFKLRSPMLKVVFRLMSGSINKMFRKMLEDYEPFEPDLFIDEGFSLQDYGFHARVLHIPGHTAGSIGILSESGDLISGDIFANMGKPGLAPNALDFNQMKASAKRLKKMNIKMFYPGHGSPFEANMLK